MIQNRFPVLVPGLIVLGLSTALSATAQLKLGTNDTQITPPKNMNFRVLSPAMTSGIQERDLKAVGPAIPMLQTFTRNIVSSKDGRTYRYTIVGQDPFPGGTSSTTIQTP